MSQGGAVVLEQLVPEGGPLCAVVEQTPADVDERTEELLPVPRRTLPAAHDRHKTVERVQVTEIDTAFPQRLPGGHVRQMKMEKEGGHQILHEILPLLETLLKPLPGGAVGGQGELYTGQTMRLDAQREEQFATEPVKIIG